MQRALTPMVFLLTALCAVAETRVRIVGMVNESEANVFELVSGRLAHVTSKPASLSRADDAAFLVLQALRRDGYAEVRVDSRVASSSEIVLTVEEGLRKSLGRVTVRGMPAADARRLARLYARPADNDRPLIGGSPPFREEDVETGLSFIRQDLNADGFWSAEATVVSRATDPANGSTGIEIDVRPGPSFRIADPQIVSADGRGVAETRAAVQPFVNRRATTGNVNAMRMAVEQVFNSSGYPNARITMDRNLETAQRFIPVVSVDLGRRVHLHQVRIEGLEKTDPRRVQVRMTALEGEWYDEAAMNRRIRNLLATGAFSSARLTTEDRSDGTIDATLHLQESRAREVSFALGADSYLGFIFRTTYTDRNLWGQLLGFSAGVEASSRGLLGEIRLTEPSLFGTDLSATGRLYSLSYSPEGYTSEEIGLEGSTTWAVNDHYTINLLAGYAITDLSADGLPQQVIGETTYRNPRLRLTQTLDYRDSPILPKNGWHVSMPLEVGAALGDVSSSYALAELSGGFFSPLGRHYQIALGGAWGVIVPSGDGADLPIDLRMFNGGARSVRSFPERELGPRVNGYPTGGEARWSANVEFIRQLAGGLKAVGFVDAGSLSTQYDQLMDSEIDVAAGLGLRLDLPIGPIRLEYGYSLTRDIGEPVGALHFAIGMAF
ncbi:MAG: BamA/OMP85 family outer membrane protein [Luteolibacter sp.]